MKEKNFVLLRVIVLGTFGLMASSLGQVQAQNIIYVDAVTSGGDGTSWATAFNDLQDALDIAAAGDEIWVAAGTYIPSKERVPGTPRSVTFNLINGVGIYGGFPSGGGTWESRNPESYVTTLSGDIGVIDNSADNAYHVVYAVLTNSATVLDGFTVMGGNANNYGGGIYIHGGSPLVSNCEIRGNLANIQGGGIHCRNGSSAVIIDCIVTENNAGYDGGGICCRDSGAVTISNCLIIDNSSTGTEGGGISCKYSSITISNCIVSNNTAPYGGGGIACYESNPTIFNCLITVNRATAVWSGGGAAGGAIGCWFSSPTIRNCTITGNSAPGKAGGIWLTNGSHVTITDTILWGNIAESWYGQELAIKAMYPGGNSSATVKYSNVEGGRDAVFLEDYFSYIAILNWDDSSNFDADPLFVSGPLGDYLLSQVTAGNPNDSPCRDTGSDLASTLNLDTLTTRTDSFPDTGQVDMGYHYGITNQPPEATITNPISGLVQPVNDPIAFEALISDPDVGDLRQQTWPG